MAEATLLGRLCRDCGWRESGPADPPLKRCPTCRSPRLVAHAELFELSIAHIDCDAFFAAVEKRDRPELADKPVLIGGGERGVVSTACYLARAYGARSAMPMSRARALCPQAVVLKPDMARYVEASREIRARFETLTPLVEPLSLDEAFLDLTGTQTLHRAPPAAMLADLARRIEREVGVSVSIGLAPNKFLAKIASEQDKPRGFAVIGAADAVAFLADKPVSIIWGVGPRMTAKLESDGYRRVGDLQAADPARLAERYGAMGERLARLARAEDARDVLTQRRARTISSETTFAHDENSPSILEARLWDRCETLSRRLKVKDVSGSVVILILRTARFQRLTRRVTLTAPTALAERIFEAARPLLHREADGERSFRLIGVGVGELHSGAEAGAEPELLQDGRAKRADAEKAVDRIRDKFGFDAIRKGRSLK